MARVRRNFVCTGNLPAHDDFLHNYYSYKGSSPQALSKAETEKVTGKCYCRDTLFKFWLRREDKLH